MHFPDKIPKQDIINILKRPGGLRDQFPFVSNFMTPSKAFVKRPVNGECYYTNRVDGGLPSADRNNKATLLLTGPYRTIKSYAKDLSPRMVKLQDAS
jgi:hypothetical protein